MFINDCINKAILFVQNSKFATFLKDSYIFKNIDNISFILLILTIILTSFAQSDLIGIFATLFCCSTIFKLFIKPNEKIEISFLNKILIVYFLFVFISLMGASYFALSLKGIIKTVIYLSFYFCAVYFLSQNKRRIIPTILTITFVVSIESVIGILQNLAHIEAIATWQDSSNVDPTKIIDRAYGTLKPFNPNLLAGYLVSGMSSIFALGVISYFRKKKKSLILFSTLFLLTIYAIFVTGSRGAYIGLFALLSVIFIFALYFAKQKFGSFRNIKAKYKAIFGGVIASLIGLLILFPSFLNRILSIFSLRKDSSISFRMNVYEACYQMFLDNKFLGIGVGNKNFREVYGLYMKTGFDALGAYSVPLEIAVESGIFALISFFAFIILILIRCVKFVLNNKTHLLSKCIIFSILLTISATMAHGLFDTIFFRPQIQILFWVNIAIFHSLTIKGEKANKFSLLK